MKYKVLRTLAIIVFLSSNVCGYGQGKVTRTPRHETHNSKPQNSTPKVTVSESDGYINGHGYVDLGLPSGTKWATCNVGSSSPDEYGNYYTWGEVETKDQYDIDNSTTYGKRIFDIKGKSQYDAASANWGNEWTLPDEDSCKELILMCKWSWGQLNGVKGKKIIGPNGKSIFLPAAGMRHNKNKVVNRGEEGSYLTSILWIIEGKCSLTNYHPLHFYEVTDGNLDWGMRIVGYPVRAISK